MVRTTCSQHMNMPMQQVSTIPHILNNEEGLYEGNLRHYFRVVFFEATNLQNAYHNFRHLFHVLWLCYAASRYYKNKLTKRQIRNLLIAAMFHDYNHSGKVGNDDAEIAKAVEAFLCNVLPEDMAEMENIVKLIEVTRFPHLPLENPSLSELIIRDADISQTFNVAWFQHTIFGLAKEMGKTALEVLKMQEGFLKNIHFGTEWAKNNFTPEVIEAKIQEAREYLSILEETPALTCSIA